MRLGALALAFLAACGSAAPPPPPPRPALQALLAVEKFRPSAFYTGVDRPEDQRSLESAVNDAIREIRDLPEPLDNNAVRDRLAALIENTDSFATEDRDEVYRYAIHTWRAAGFIEESGLFALPDDQVLARP